MHTIQTNSVGYAVASTVRDCSIRLHKDRISTADDMVSTDCISERYI
jgi:hypothetical protein